MLSRRDFLQAGAAGLSFVSLAGGVPRLLARAAEESATAEANDHVLVVVELAGGNDGLNTLIPFEDPLYYTNRPTLGIPKDQALKLTDLAGLHPQMAPLAEQFKEGRLAVIQGVGYPQPDRSHFRSMEIWHTASTASAVPPTGWLGRALDQITPADSDALSGLALTGSLPQAFQAERVVVPVVGQLENVAQVGEEASPRDKLLRKLSTAGASSATSVAFMRQQAQAVYRAAERLRHARTQYQSTVEYPETGLGQQLQQAARIIAANIGTRILFVSQDGYDTHSDQAGSHAQLMEDLAGSLAAFQQDLAMLKADGQVATMVFSEFGRRVDENGSQGTDHGAAGTMFVMGSRIKGGLYGQPPSLAELGDGDLIFNADFRTVYTPLLDNWLGCPAEKLLGEKFAPLDILA